MRSSPFAFWFVVTCCSLEAASAQAQPRRGVSLTVSARSNGSTACFDPNDLQTRIAFYGRSRRAAAAELRLDLIVDGPDSAELLVYRGNQFVSRRSFANLPGACADRRDTVALSIALAIEAALTPAASASSGEVPVDGAATQAPSQPAGSEPGSAPEAQPDVPPSVARPVPLPAAAPAQPAPVEPDEPAAATSTGEPGEPTEPVDEVRPSVETRAPRPRPFVDLHVGGRWLAEAVPAPVWAGALGAELWVTRRFALDLSAFASTLGNSTFEGGRAQAWVSGGELLGCAAWKLGSFGAQGCLGAIAAACRASGRGYPSDRPSSSVLWAATAARASVRWPDEDLLSLRLLIQGNLNLVRPELEVDGAVERLHPSWVGLAAGLDLIVSLE